MNEPDRINHDEFIKEVQKVANDNWVNKSKNPDKLIYCKVCNKYIRYINVRFHLKTLKHLLFIPLEFY